MNRNFTQLCADFQVFAKYPQNIAHITYLCSRELVSICSTASIARLAPILFISFIY